METEEAVRGEEPCLPGAAAPAEQPIIATAVEDLDEAAVELYDEELFDADVQQAAASSDTPPGVFTAVMSRTAEEELEPALYRQRKRQQKRGAAAAEKVEKDIGVSGGCCCGARAG